MAWQVVSVALLLALQSAAGGQVLYQPAASSTFVAHKELPFTVQYADSNAIEAITCVDYVQLGEYKARVPFACFLKASTPMLKDVDGVAGFGIPKLGAHGEALPMPLLWALTDPSNVETNSQTLERRFTFFSSPDSAELQLGGYDPKSILGEMTQTASLSAGEFIVGVTSIKVGVTPETAVETLLFLDHETAQEKGMRQDGMLAHKENYLPAVLDTGTSCLVLPSNDHGGKLQDAPFKIFVQNFVTQETEEASGSPWSAAKARLVNENHNYDKGEKKLGTNVYMMIGGKQYTLPYETLLIKGTNKPCVRGSPPLQQSSIILGDVFFHSYAVEFDMRLSTRTNPATIGLAAINPEYKIIPESTPIIPVTQMGSPLVRMHVHKELDKLPIDNERGVKYFVQVTIGTPPQLFKLAFDTGSSTLGVFVAQPTMNNVLLEEIGGRPLRVRPIPYLNADGTVAEQAQGPVELEQVQQGAPGGSRKQSGMHDGWRTALRTVAMMGGAAILCVVLVLGGRRVRR